MQTHRKKCGRSNMLNMSSGNCSEPFASGEECEREYTKMTFWSIAGSLEGYSAFGASRKGHCEKEVLSCASTYTSYQAETLSTRLSKRLFFPTLEGLGVQLDGMSLALVLFNMIRLCHGLVCVMQASMVLASCKTSP